MIMQASKRQELLALMADKMNRAVRLYMENCTRCGTCIDACHAYASTRDIRFSAVGRAQNVRRLFENYFSITGKAAPWLSDAETLDEAWMDKLYETAFSCTGCRRCMVYCPFGIDTQQIQAIAKVLLIGMDMDPKPLTMRARGEIDKVKNLEVTRQKLEKELAGVAKELVEKYPSLEGKEIVPLDKEGANVLYVSMAEKPSIGSGAAILNAAGESWSLSYFEAVNFGAFAGNANMSEQIYRRIVDEAERLRVKELVICECGTAYRIMKHIIGRRSFRVISILELVDRYLREGRIKLDKSAIEGTVTYHDPCQIARNSGVYEAPRNVIRTLTDNFVEMVPNRSENWCCGGGGGLVIAQEPEFRMMTSRVKADQIRAAGADILATACEMCLAQLKDLNDEFELETDVKLVSDLVYEALVFS
jgi:Fe-S oxidoreductase